jgi:hypothetical protein
VGRRSLNSETVATDRLAVGRASLIRLAAVAAVLAAPSTAAATTFRVSPSGDDGARGSRSHPWATIARVDAQDLRPGDRVLFRGGATFRGNLRLDARDSGRGGAPVTIGSYGGGRATLNGGGSPALLASGTEGLVVQDLDLVGSGARANRATGLLVYAGGGRLLGPVTLRRLSASGWGDAGVGVGGWGPGSGYRDVVLDRVDAHDNGRAGISVWAQRPNTNRDVVIRRSRAWDNRGVPGTPDGQSSGNGIVLGGTDGGRIHHSAAFRNGGLDDNPHQGPAGIWTYDSNAVRIDHDASYDNRTGSTVDGDGFDLDQNVTNSVLEDNVSHGNDGPGIVWANGPNRRHTPGNVIRRNVSRDDARRLPLASLLLWHRAAGLRVEHNTVIAGHAAALGFLDPAPGGPDARIRFNRLVAGPGRPLIATIGSATAPGARLERNEYVAAGDWLVDWAGTAYGSMASWRAATGQERTAP